MDVGLGLSEDLPLGEQRGIARRVEEHGLRSLWTNEARGRDALLTCHAWGMATSSLEVGVGVVPVWTRTPAQLAMGAATLQEDVGDRFLLGLGVSHPATMGAWHGVDHHSPLAAARESIQILRELTAGREADVAGDVFSSRRFALEVNPLPPAPTLYLGAMGPKMLRLAGEVADGVLLNWSSPGEIAAAGKRVRSPGRAVEVAAYVRVAVSEDRGAARRALAAEIGRYCALPAYAAHFERQGLGSMVGRVKAAYKRGGTTAVADALSDDELLELGWFGTPSQDPTDTFHRYSEAGLDHLVARVVVPDGDAVSAVASVLAALPATVPA